MPTINVDTRVSVDIDEDVDVDILEVLDECDATEIQQAIEWLEEGGYLSGYDVSEKTYPHDQFYQSMMSISQNYYMLTPEEQATIENIANKYK